MSEEQVLDLLSDSHFAPFITAIRPYVSALIRQGNKDLLEQVVTLAAQKRWVEADRLMFPLMNDDERERLSLDIFTNARSSVNLLNLGEELAKKLIMKLAMYYLGNIDQILLKEGPHETSCD